MLDKCIKGEHRMLDVIARKHEPVLTLIKVTN